MAETSIKEGEVNQVTGTNTLKYPDINSCLSLTAVFADNKRVGGHAVMFPAAPQLNLKQICDYLIANKGTSNTLIIVGDIGTWNGNWSMLDETKNLVINGRKVNNAGELGPAMGFANNILKDTIVCDANGSTYDVFFGFEGANRVYWCVDHKTNSICATFGKQPW
ncbi:hypothetical protein CLV59_105474 [Chitinophaga dinghuensis]|uniref:Uncharacterized protein n=1 Tax=Chitinophaga dinghuensis TaxID=1539050 RepID=A0A327VZK8_9BACT|nr:hypothetical protein [Chitinophaga dinghuensis]RAJ80365.1 hypothetical protein CLV59_105474 [Chitinophaga dinghuensis]